MTGPGSGRMRTGQKATPLLWVGGLILGVTALLLAWVANGTIRASRDHAVRAGLDYRTFLGALDDLIEGAGDSALIRFDEIEDRISGNRLVRFDTIAVLADVESFPAFRRAGFLNDQIQAYNRFQKDRVALGRESAEWYDRLRAYNPSVFRSYRRPDGSNGLTRSPAAWSLRVRSPLEGEWSGEIRASDVSREVGLLSPRASISLRKPASLVRPVSGRMQLFEFVPAHEDVRVYCLSEERIAQATLLLRPDGRSQPAAVAGWTHLWVDGRRIQSGDSVNLPRGSVIRLDPLEPLVFADRWEGVLSSKQWVNGRMRRRSDLPQPLDLFAALGSGPADLEGRASAHASVDLAVSAEASRELTDRLSRFLRTEVGIPLDFGMVILARVPDGEIVAVAETGERKHLGRSSILERVAPGSAVKPLLAAAILSERPELATMKTPARSGSVTTVLGMPGVRSRRAFSTSLNCAPPTDGYVDLRYFLKCSNNEFAASLLVAGLVDGGVPGESWRGRSEVPLNGTDVPRATLLRSPLSEGLSALFDVPTDPTIADAMGRSRRVWEGVSFSDGSPVRVPHELLPSESRPALLAPGSPEGTDLSLLYRYAYGAWENQWTLLDLITGFARIVTDRKIQLRFFPKPDGPVTASGEGAGAATADGQASETEGDPETGMGLREHSWYPVFLAGLRGVGVDGTASGLRAAWRDEGLPGTLMAKTGTLNEPGEPTPTDDLFAKSLLFAVGEPSEDPVGSLGCGMVGGVYLRFSKPPPSGVLPSYQVAFARRELGEFLRKHWDELGGC